MKGFVATVCMAAGLSGVALATTAAPALAHTQRAVGAYHFTVGWNQEPIYAGVNNAVVLFLTTNSGKAVNDLGDSLKVEVVFGRQKMTLPLELAFDPDAGEGQPGEYLAPFIPTVAGNYTFHFVGSIRGQKVDETFVPSSSGLEPVSDPSEAEFPAKEPPVAQVAALAQRLSSRVQAAQTAQRQAQDSADSAKTVGLIGIVVGAVGLVVAIAALVASRRKPASPNVAAPATETAGERRA
jgi:hypothetical protein